MCNLLRYFIGLLAVVSAFAWQLGAQTLPVSGTQLDVDLLGNIYILNGEQNTLRLLSKENTIIREVGGSGWQNEQFDRPSGIWARNGIDVFVADFGNHRIQRFDRQLNYVSTLSTRDSDNPEERFGYPGDVAVSRLADLYICDTENSRIVKLNSLNNAQITFGGFGGGKGRLQNPSRVKIGPKDFLFVLDAPRVLVYDSFGNYVRELCEGLLKQPTSLFADQNSVVVLDGNLLYCFDQEVRPVGTLPLSSPVANDSDQVRSITFSNGWLYLLVANTLVIVPDPRAGLVDQGLEKNEKTR